MGIIKKYSPEISLFLSVCIALFIPFISSKTSLPLGIINNDIPSNMVQQIIVMIKAEYVFAYFAFIISILVLRFFPLKLDIRPFILAGLIFVVRQFLTGMQNETSIGLHIESKAGPAYYLLVLGILSYVITSIKNSKNKLFYILPIVLLIEPTFDLITSSISLGIYSLAELLKLIIPPLIIIIYIISAGSRAEEIEADLITKEHGKEKHYKRIK
ncbi:hypothetical protein [Streptococcus mitis]|jgi:hypothetical protein|uniref:Uncharacterized protein n=2 Tax=Streptococcus mitis TaxID=28037 RepID=A0A1X1L9C6_STRMT|nr:hypothetical protein [Streptococcus mitis]MQQ51288.1 hypothetical protein [Streptococcus mitis]ORP08311.1 hypothetical protein B7692_00465 [Streptococcus mitis]